MAKTVKSRNFGNKSKLHKQLGKNRNFEQKTQNRVEISSKIKMLGNAIKQGQRRNLVKHWNLWGKWWNLVKTKNYQKRSIFWPSQNCYVYRDMQFPTLTLSINFVIAWIANSVERLSDDCNRVTRTGNASFTSSYSLCPNTTFMHATTIWSANRWAAMEKKSKKHTTWDAPFACSIWRAWRCDSFSNLEN